MFGILLCPPARPSSIDPWGIIAPPWGGVTRQSSLLMPHRSTIRLVASVADPTEPEVISHGGQFMIGSCEPIEADSENSSM
jgi:hypothetical protein